MKSEGKIKQWLVFFLCIMTAFSIMTQAALADPLAEPTGLCTNIQTEGIEYFVPVSVLADPANNWRTDLVTKVTKGSYGDTAAGEIIAMELETTTDTTRYQCTKISPGTEAVFSCNSIPVNAIISGVYFRYVPNTSVSKDSNIHFYVREFTNKNTLLTAHSTVQYPPSPCGRNVITKDLVDFSGGALIYNTSEDCTNNKVIEAYETEEPYAIVNIIPGDTIVEDRLMVEVTPHVNYSYKMEIIFLDVDGGQRSVKYDWDGDLPYQPNDPIQPNPELGYDWGTDVDITKLPLTLYKVNITDISTTRTDIWGNPDFPANTNFNIKFYYENTEGTLGYQNSIFHFERNMYVTFSSFCNESSANLPMSAAASTLYDPCQSSQQMFSISLKDSAGKGIIIPKTQADGDYCDSSTDATCVACDDVEYCTDIYSVKPQVHDYSIDHKTPSASNYRFITRKCRDAFCESYTTTGSYPYSLTFSDGLSMSRTYKHQSNSSGSNTVFQIRAYDDTVLKRPFAITGVRFVADGPGTYVIFGFVDNQYAKSNDLKHYAVKFYVTINQTNQLTTCSTLANNGYFRAYWNDCLSFAETQLMSFEHIPGTEEAWIQNRSAHGIHFPYVPEFSYLPQKLQVGSLNCKFEAIGSSGQPGKGYCNPDDVYVPPYTKVTITGGTVYLEARPSVEEYWVAYAREETRNIAHLIMSIPVKECENVRKIPNTGISLRSPLDVKESVDAATSYAFTGNSLRIPAIGLGMETPIPIVHVYYDEGSTDLEWDLSTLGNYVGELEGGSYLPYAGNSALTGHYYSAGVFKNLEHLNYEDEIIIFGNDGIKYTYKVVQKFLANPSDVYEMFQQVGERSLTLVTCENYNLLTDEYERRQLIRATIDSMEPYEVTW